MRPLIVAQEPKNAKKGRRPPHWPFFLSAMDRSAVGGIRQ
jgi:hypothetical protein